MNFKKSPEFSKNGEALQEWKQEHCSGLKADGQLNPQLDWTSMVLSVDGTPSAAARIDSRPGEAEQRRRFA